MAYLFQEFEQINKKSGAQFSIIMSYYQIYNEQIKDLLIRDNRQPMDICEDPLRGTIITNLAQVEITSREEIMELL